MRRWARGSLGALALLAACGGARGGGGPTVQTVSLDADAAAARALVAAFIAAEAALDAGADTMLSSGAEFVASGIAVASRPRLAGMTGPGLALVESGTTQLAGSFAWVVVVYRFESRTSALNDRGRATAVLEKQRAGWRIRHVHSSAVERW